MSFSHAVVLISVLVFDYMVMVVVMAALLSYKAHKDRRRIDGGDFIFALVWPVTLPMVILYELFRLGVLIGVKIAKKKLPESQ